MSKTDKTRPWWVRMADAPTVTRVAMHDHRFGPCTLPDDITPDSASLSHRTSGGCYWSATAYAYHLFGYGEGGREWYLFRRETRRRSRHRTRRELRAQRGRRADAR
ncbi:hypothetical protein [Streptomyces cavernae]|uniref:hypothetical protein n=1 Tax=Streptomyces cavernae TaxID=2259034 RepID=UPI000FEBE2DC|nr:hypothetical protein [Streptomyces cavernae]